MITQYLHESQVEKKEYFSDFTFQDLLITSNSPRLVYRKKTGNKNSVHWGQRKLLLSEILFFTEHWDKSLIPEPTCVYAGAAPGVHIDLLSKMFPSFNFILYDPAPFAMNLLGNNPKIKILTGKNGFFTNDEAKKYADRKDIFFISDIRTADYRGINNEILIEEIKKSFPDVEIDENFFNNLSEHDYDEDSFKKQIINVLLKAQGITEFDENHNPKGPYDLIKASISKADQLVEDKIWSDMNLQQTWVQIMNPEHVLLKFRLPYSLDGKDKIVKYLKGQVYWQIWSPQTSTETRLKPVRNIEGKYELSDWSILEYEEWCFYHNVFVRQHMNYKNIFTNSTDPIASPELLNDYDSMGETYILKLYFNKIGDKDLQKMYETVVDLSGLITWSINHYSSNRNIKTLSKIRLSKNKFSIGIIHDPFIPKNVKMEQSRPLLEGSIETNKLPETVKVNPLSSPNNIIVNSEIPLITQKQIAVPSLTTRISSSISLIPPRSPLFRPPSSTTITSPSVISPPSTLTPVQILPKINSQITTPPIATPSRVIPQPSNIAPSRLIPQSPIVTPSRVIPQPSNITPPVATPSRVIPQPSNIATPSRVIPQSPIVTPSNITSSNIVTPSRVIPQPSNITPSVATPSRVIPQPSNITPSRLIPQSPIVTPSNITPSNIATPSRVIPQPSNIATPSRVIPQPSNIATPSRIIPQSPIVTPSNIATPSRLIPQPSNIVTPSRVIPQSSNIATPSRVIPQSSTIPLPSRSSTNISIPTPKNN